MAEATHEGTTAPGDAGGLPQFDPQWWPGQIVWFLIIFAVVFVLMRWVFVPRIGGTIAAREGKIEGDIAHARSLRDQAEDEARRADDETKAARASAQRTASEARAKAQAEIAERLAVEEAKLAETLEAAEARIRATRDEAMVNVRAIAADAAVAIVAKLTGRPVTAEEVDAALTGKA